MKKVVLFLIVLISVGLGQEYQSEKELTEEDLFLSPYFLDMGMTHAIASDGKGHCRPVCREVKEGYKTRITDFDARSGVTICEVYRENDLENPLGFNGGTKHHHCLNIRSYAEKFTESYRSGEIFAKEAKIEYEPRELPLSRFLAGVMTLDPEIINFDKTKATGMLFLNNPTAVYGTNIVNFSQKNGTTNETQLTAVADSLNKANMAYYSSLYANMNEIYKYLQNLLFVFVGMFFVTSIAFKKATQMLDKSQSDDGGRILSGFSVPVLAFCFFFIPIPEDAGMQANVIQKITRYFVQQSTIIADKASAIGTNTYLIKLFSTVGAQTARGEMVMRIEEDATKHGGAVYSEVLKNFCNNRYPNTPTYQLNEDEFLKHERINPNNIQGKYDISFQACNKVERRQQEQQTLNKEYGDYLKQMDRSFKNGELKTKLSKISSALNERQNELGWVQATMIPSISILVESTGILADNSAVNQAQKENKKKIKKSSKQKEKPESEESIFDRLLDGSRAIVGDFFGRFAYFILPGASEVYKQSYETIGTATDMITSVIPIARIPLIKMVANVGAKIGSIYIMSAIYSYMLTLIPVVACVVASIIALLSYLIELAKYFYVTPFVVAFGVTTKRTHKIMDFLVQGIAIFFKPILIVIFIFFSLFIHSLVQDVFMVMTMEQFLLIGEVNESFFLGFSLAVFEGLLSIIGTIGSVYIMWKLILTAPAWVMKMVGIESSGDMVTDSLANKLEKQSFQV